NSAQNGGGMQNANSTAVLTNVLISGNWADNDGAGVYNYYSSFTLTNGTISSNYKQHGASGIFNFYAASGIFNFYAQNIVLRNSIIYGNYDFNILNYNPPNSMEISYCMYGKIAVNDNTVYQGNISPTDPQFINAPSYFSAPFVGGDFHLQSTSPLINVGNNIYFKAGQVPDLSAITTDLSDVKRIKGGTIDLGAYEYSYPLPINLLTFTAQSDGNRAKLNWTTAKEINNKEFIVSRSVDGKNFKEIGNVTGQGNTNAVNDYVFFDEDPLNGINYYQLSQIDFDGHKTDVGVRTVHFSFEGNNGIKIYPNPVKNSANIEFSAGIYSQAELTDVNGKVLQHLVLSIMDTEKKLDMSNIPSGIYFIKLAGNNKIESRKVVKE
ncbi:MAG: T9SS type A sorting domain-containing protein, partial [Ginsengibacter sp.]